MTFNIQIAPVADFATSKADKAPSELQANRQQFVDSLGEAILQSAATQTPLLLLVPLDGDTTIANQQSRVARYAKHAAEEHGVTVTVARVRGEKAVTVRLSPESQAAVLALGATENTEAGDEGEGEGEEALAS